jgi:3-methyladenine DNA glycosylase/8-oxoguanine DNA glycosylase
MGNGELNSSSELVSPTGYEVRLNASIELAPLALPEPFDLRRLVWSHGWVQLDPFRWDDQRGRLSYSMCCPSSVVCTWSVAQESPEELRLWVEAAGCLNAADEGEIIAAARWALRLDESFAGFHSLCEEHAGLHSAGRCRLGRLLRSPTVWEDAAKTILTTCTTWDRTCAMARALCRTWGTPAAGGVGTSFPAPSRIAALSEADLRQVGGLGYRARYLHALARAAVDPSASLEAFKDDPRPTTELRSALLALPGIGPYGAANLLMLLGHYDQIALDSWVRRVVSKGWFGGTEASDREILAAFDRFGPWKALVYWFWDWEGAAEEWSWRYRE